MDATELQWQGSDDSSARKASLVLWLPLPFGPLTKTV